MHRLPICSRCLRRLQPHLSQSSSFHQLPSLLAATSGAQCTHTRSNHSRWFALYEGVNRVDLPSSEMPSTSTSALSVDRTKLIRSPRRSASTSIIPTLVDQSELGGHDTMDDAAAAFLTSTTPSGVSPSTSLYDFDSLLATLEEANLELPFTTHDPAVPSRDLLPATALQSSRGVQENAAAAPVLVVPPRRVLEKERERPMLQHGRSMASTRAKSSRLRSSLLSSRLCGVRTRFAAAASAASPALAHIVVEESREEEKVEEVLSTRFSPMKDREQEVDPSELMNAVAMQDISAVRQLLNVAQWPQHSSLLHARDVSTVFSLIVSEAEDVEECRAFLRDFAASSPRYTLPAVVSLWMAERVAREEGVARAAETVAQMEHMFRLRTPKLPYLRKHIRQAENALWRAVFKKQLSSSLNISPCEEMYAAASAQELVEGPRMFVREALRALARREVAFTELLSEWTRLAKRYGVDGDALDVLVESAMVEDGERKVLERIGRLSSFVSSSPSLRVEAILVQILCTLLKRGAAEDARSVFAMVTIPGRHFGPVLRLLEEEQNLEVVEKLASLVSDCVYGEKRRRGRQEKKEAEGVKEEEEEAVEKKNAHLAHLEELVSVVCGMQRRGDKRKKKYVKPDARKKVKVDAMELHDLAVRIQKSWLKLARGTVPEDVSSLRRLDTWSTTHGLSTPSEMDDSVAVPEKRESGV